MRTETLSGENREEVTVYPGYADEPPQLSDTLKEFGLTWPINQKLPGYFPADIDHPLVRSVLQNWTNQLRNILGEKPQQRGLFEALGIDLKPGMYSSEALIFMEYTPACTVDKLVLTAFRVKSHQYGLRPWLIEYCGHSSRRDENASFYPELAAAEEQVHTRIHNPWEAGAMSGQ